VCGLIIRQGASAVYGKRRGKLCARVNGGELRMGGILPIQNFGLPKVIWRSFYHHAGNQAVGKFALLGVSIRLGATRVSGEFPEQRFV
jgi:hypothetical protein